MDNMQNILFAVALAKNPELPNVRPSESKRTDKRDDFHKMMHEQVQKEKPEEESKVKPQDPSKAEEETETLQQLAAMQIACANLAQTVIPADAEAQQTVAVPMQQAVVAPVQTQPQTAETAAVPGETVQTSQVATPDLGANAQAAEDVAAQPKPLDQAVSTGEAENLPQTEQVKPLEENLDSAKDLGNKGQADAKMPADVKVTAKEDDSNKSVFSHVDSAPVKVSDTAEPSNAEKPQSVENQVMKELEKAITAKQPKIELQLNPSNLGKITIEMTQNKDGTLYIALHAENREVRSILERGLSDMQSYLRQNTQQEVQVQVPRQDDHQQRQFNDQQRQGHQQQQQEQHQSHKDSEDFLNQLRLGLVTAAETAF